MVFNPWLVREKVAVGENGVMVEEEKVRSSDIAMEVMTGSMDWLIDMFTVGLEVV